MRLKNGYRNGRTAARLSSANAAPTMQSDGKLVVGGRTGEYPFFNFGVARYSRDGQLDQSFGTAVGGDGSRHHGDGSSRFGDGKIVLAGIAFNGRLVMQRLSQPLTFATIGQRPPCRPRSRLLGRTAQDKAGLFTANCSGFPFGNGPHRMIGGNGQDRAADQLNWLLQTHHRGQGHCRRAQRRRIFFRYQLTSARCGERTV